jgi:LPXTG-site transpeptidase (sortase) family protein
VAGALAAAGLALLCGCGPASPARVSSDGGGTPASAPADPSPTASATGTPGHAAAMARSVPRRLRVPAIGVDTAVMSLGLAADGGVRVPPIAAHSPAGWYDGSPTPGQTGPAVILGHVTVGAYGDGVFAHLDRLRPGDRVTVVRQDGSTAVFSVDSVQTVAKSRFPTSAVYGNVDHPALRLITCGGARISGGGGYPDNVIVYASLVSGS